MELRTGIPPDDLEMDLYLSVPILLSIGGVITGQSYRYDFIDEIYIPNREPFRESEVYIDEDKVDGWYLLHEKHRYLFEE